MAADFSLEVRFYRLSARLQPFFTALTQFDITCQPGAMIEDLLHPEWSAMRFSTGQPLVAACGTDPLARCPSFAVSGPTSRAVRIGIGPSRVFGLGLHPAGWARFVGADASGFADRIIDGAQDPAFAAFAPILPLVEDPRAAPEAVAERINDYLLGHLERTAARPQPRLALIRQLHEALRDPGIAHVAELAERLGTGLRSLERISLRTFGFPPKVLLRRQRFLRSLARYMLAPGGKWSEALDEQYCDQAQFVRDFRAFMGMTPSDYSERPHPILSPTMGQRMADLGAAPQTDLPTVLRYLGDPLASGGGTRRTGDRAGD